MEHLAQIVLLLTVALLVVIALQCAVLAIKPPGFVSPILLP